MRFVSYKINRTFPMWLFYLMKFIALIDLFISEPKNIEFSKLRNVGFGCGLNKKESICLKIINIQW